MRARTGIIVVCAALAGLGGTSVQAGSLGEVVSMFDYELTLDYYSHYVWRGQLLNESSFQPGFSAAYGGVTAAFWGQYDLTDDTGHQWQFTEVDWSVDYTTAIPGVEWASVSVGMIYYNFATTAAADTTELYWGFSFDSPLSPYVTVYHDLDEIQGMYVNTGVSHAWDEVFTLGQIPVGLELGASLGWADGDYNNGYWGVADDGLNDFTLSLAMPMEWGQWSVTPSLNWTALVDNKIRDTNAFSDSDNYFYAGVSFARSF